MQSAAEKNKDIAARLSNNLSRLLREFSRDFERRVDRGLSARGYADIRPSHSTVFANLGTGAVRVTELAERAQVTQQAMGKMLKELERMGYVTRDVDSGDKRAKAIRLTPLGEQLAADIVAVVADTRRDYAEKIGHYELENLEASLRHALNKLELDYLPSSWANADSHSGSHF